MDHDVNRRDVLRAGGVAVVTAVAAAGCDALSTKPSSGKGGGGGASTSGQESKPKEAPMLTKLVKAGKLPPLKERVPPEPVVIKPVDRIGTYGGQWRLAVVRNPATTGQGTDITAGYENLVRWDPEFKKIIPNLADSWEVNDTGTEYTFKLHKGVKWSDGHPFTADDIVFACEDVLMNKELNPIPPFGVMSAKKVDDVTVKITFEEPNGLFITNMATQRGNNVTDYPRHYLEQFHKKYNPDVDALAKKAKQDNWIALFGQMGGDYSYGTNTDKPCLKGWVLKSNTKTELVIERNPYYWKADPEGSQLPYMDQLVWQYVSDEQTALLKVANGEIDFGYQDANNKPVLARSRGKGKYRFFNAVPAGMSNLLIDLNLAHKDPVKRKIFQDRDFRIGLSYAINRKEINDAVFQRQGEPWQIAPRRESSYYDEELATQFLEYDVDKANQYLDKSFPDKDGNGVRLGPDGKPITFQIDAIAQYSQNWVDGMQLVVGYWKKVGVDAKVKTVSPSLGITRAEANLHDAEAYGGEGGLDAVILVNTFNYIPVTAPYCFFGVPWAAWYSSGGKEGEAPPAYVKQQLKLYDQVKATADPDEQRKLMREIFKIVKDEFAGIGTLAPTTAYGVVSTRTQNFPKYHVTGTVWVYMDPAATDPCQYFIEE